MQRCGAGASPDAMLANAARLAHRIDQMIAVSRGFARDIPWVPGVCRCRIDSDVRTAAILALRDVRSVCRRARTTACIRVGLDTSGTTAVGIQPVPACLAPSNADEGGADGR